MIPLDWRSTYAGGSNVQRRTGRVPTRPSLAMWSTLSDGLRCPSPPAQRRCKLMELHTVLGGYMSRTRGHRSAGGLGGVSPEPFHLAAVLLRGTPCTTVPLREAQSGRNGTRRGVIRKAMGGRLGSDSLGNQAPDLKNPFVAGHPDGDRVARDQGRRGFGRTSVQPDVACTAGGSGRGTCLVGADRPQPCINADAGGGGRKDGHGWHRVYGVDLARRLPDVPLSLACRVQTTAAKP